MDIVYVVYFDGQMYKGYGGSKRKAVYTELKNANQIITKDSKEIAKIMYEKANKNTHWNVYLIAYWYELTKEEQEKWINKARQRFEIKEFVERV